MHTHTYDLYREIVRDTQTDRWIIYTCIANTVHLFGEVARAREEIERDVLGHAPFLCTRIPMIYTERSIDREIDRQID